MDRRQERLPIDPPVDLGFARVDIGRSKRQGTPEVVLCTGKTPSQVADILEVLVRSEGLGIATRASRRVYQTVQKRLPEARFHPKAGLVWVGTPLPTQDSVSIAVVSAGTSDGVVAEELAVTASLLGHPVERINDVGVAGLHRVLGEVESLRKASVVVVVAGMDAALASVVAGLVDVPVIAVPTSQGYGATFDGLSALLAMLASCVPGVAVVNIDNGFGAAVLAHRMIASVRQR
jgi:NCAIR mutase (PurE)-related protein